jgi:Mg-chelatase subunit ChlD
VREDLEEMRKQARRLAQDVLAGAHQDTADQTGKKNGAGKPGSEGSDATGKPEGGQSASEAGADGKPGAEGDEKVGTDGDKNAGASGDKKAGGDTKKAGEDKKAGADGDKKAEGGTKKADGDKNAEGDGDKNAGAEGDKKADGDTKKAGEGKKAEEEKAKGGDEADSSKKPGEAKGAGDRKGALGDPDGKGVVGDLQKKSRPRRSLDDVVIDPADARREKKLIEENEKAIRQVRDPNLVKSYREERKEIAKQITATRNILETAVQKSTTPKRSNLLVKRAPIFNMGAAIQHTLRKQLGANVVDPLLFNNRETQTKRSFLIITVYDCSGSMGAELARNRRKSQMLIHNATSPRAGIYTADIAFSDTAAVLKREGTILDESGVATLIEVTDKFGGNSTNTCAAVRKARELAKGRKADGVLIIVVTDGASNLGGEPPELRKLVEEIEDADGFPIIGFGIGGGIQAVEYAFRNHVMVPDIERLPSKMSKVVKETVKRSLDSNGKRRRR